jgi:hypothetical protein
MADNANTSQNSSDANAIDPEFAKMFSSAAQTSKTSPSGNAPQSNDSIDPEFSSLFNKAATKTPSQLAEELKAHPESEQAYNAYKSSLQAYNKQPSTSLANKLPAALSSLALEGYNVVKGIGSAISGATSNLFHAPIQTERNVVQAAESNLPVGALQVPEMVGNIVAGGAGKVAGLVSPDTGTTIAARLQQAKGYENKVNQLITQHPEATDAILAAIPGYDSLVKGRKVLESLNTFLGGKPYDPNAPESQIGAMAGQVAGGSKVPLPKLGSTGEVAADVAGIGQKALTDVQRERIFTSLQQPSTGVVGKTAQALTPPLISKAAKLAGITEKSPTPLSKFSSLNNLSDEVDRLTESVGGIQQQISDLGAGEATAANPKYRGLTKELNQTKADLETAQKAQNLVNQKITDVQNRGGLITNTVTSGLRGAGTGALVGGVSGALTNAPGEPVSRDIVRGGAFGGALGAAGAATEQLTRPSETPAPETPTQQPPVLPATPQEATVGTPEAKAGTPAPETATPAPVATPAPTKPLAAQASITSEGYGPNRVRLRTQYTVAGDVKSMSHDEVTDFDKTLKSDDSPIANAIPVNKGDIESVGHGSDYMYIKFNKPTVYKGENIDQYAYSNVPKSVYTEMLNSDDPYGYFQKNIRRQYNTTAINPIHTKEDLTALSNGKQLPNKNEPISVEETKAPEETPAEPTKPLAAQTEAPISALAAPRKPAGKGYATAEQLKEQYANDQMRQNFVNEVRNTANKVEANVTAQLQAEKQAKIQKIMSDVNTSLEQKRQAIADQRKAEQDQLETIRNTPEYQQMTEWLKKADTMVKKSVVGSAKGGPLNPIPAPELDSALKALEARRSAGPEQPNYPKFSGKKPVKGIVYAMKAIGENDKLTPEQESIKQAILDHDALAEQERTSSAAAVKLKEKLAAQANKPLANVPAPKTARKKVSLAASQPHEGPEEKPLGTSSP